MSLASAFAVSDAVYANTVLKDTRGHLAPKKSKTYKGHITFALGCFGSDHLNPTVLEFKMGKLHSSPWLFEAMQVYLGSLEGETGGVYRWDGSFRNYKFTGSARRLTLT